jgi:hypothetical protein
VTRDDWMSDFMDELMKLRPHLSLKFATTLALQHYSPKARPRVAAREYHAGQLNQTAAVPAKKKRAK